MVNISYTESSQDMVWVDPETGVKRIYQMGDIAWILTSTALVWLMIPGLGFFYSGLLRRKNALSMILAVMLSVAVVSIQWFLIGFSLTFSETGSAYIGNFKYSAFQNVLDHPSMGSERIPVIVYYSYELMFAAITPAIAVGAIAERGRIGPLLVFVFVWSTLVYDPIACWIWNKNGWSSILGAIDFAGGTPVHISSGTAALAISIYLGKRRGYGTERLAYRPQNMTYVVLGTGLLWFGWFGFNGGSTLSANMRAAQACIVTNLSASVGGLTWMLWDYRIEKKWSAVGFCSGAIAGLVVITPGSGYIGTPSAMLFGFMAGTLCNFATQLKFFFGFDDALDIFATHTVGGVVGNLLTGLFAQKSVAHYDGLTNIAGGWLDRHYIQLAYQLADSVAGLSYSFVMTTAILWIMHYIPGLCLRVSADDEAFGIDGAEIGEVAYDYVNLEQVIGHPMDDAEAANNHELPESRRNRTPKNVASLDQDSLDTRYAS